jgi:hypothetical protein
MDDRELMQMALDALKDAALCVQHNSCPPDGGNDWDEQIEALRDRLAQPEPEPIKRSFSDDVGRLLKAGKGFYDDGTPIDYKDIQLKIEGAGEDTFECVEVRIPRPPQREWVSLTDEEIKEIVGPWGETPVNGYTRKLFDQIEAKLREKNNG